MFKFIRRFYVNALISLIVWMSGLLDKQMKFYKSLATLATVPDGIPKQEVVQEDYAIDLVSLDNEVMDLMSIQKCIKHMGWKPESGTYEEISNKLQMEMVIKNSFNSENEDREEPKGMTIAKLIETGSFDSGKEYNSGEKSRKENEESYNVKKDELKELEEFGLNSGDYHSGSLQRARTMKLMKEGKIKASPTAEMKKFKKSISPSYGSMTNKDKIGKAAREFFTQFSTDKDMKDRYERLQKLFPNQAVITYNPKSERVELVDENEKFTDEDLNLLFSNIKEDE